MGHSADTGCSASGTLDVYAAEHEAATTQASQWMEETEAPEQEPDEGLNPDDAESEDAQADDALLEAQGAVPGDHAETGVLEEEAPPEGGQEPGDADAATRGGPADAAFFPIAGPDGAEQSWNGTAAGAVTVCYDGVYDPELTVTVALRPRGGAAGDFLRPGGNGVCHDAARLGSALSVHRGRRGLPVYILLPENLFTRIVVYDETWLPWFPGLMVPLQYADLKPQQEVRLAILSEDENGGFILLSNPPDLIRSDRPLIVFAEPDAAYVTLVPEPGTLTLGIERGRRQSVRVGSGEQVDVYYRYHFEKTDSWYALCDGYSLKSAIAAEVRSGGSQAVENGGRLV